MISAAVGFLAMQLNQQFKSNFQLAEDVAVVSNLLELDGSPAPNANNKLVLTLVNVEKDSMPVRPATAGGSRGLNLLQMSSPLFLNLYVMLSANFGAGNYAESLKYLSHAISFFQQAPVLDRHSCPGMDPRIEKLALEIENLAIPDLNNVWSLLGGRYLPSMFYKVRMVMVDPQAPLGQLPVITNLKPSVGV